MKIEPTPLYGLVLLRPEPFEDARGSFTRLCCTDQLAAAGIGFAPAQLSASFNPGAFTLRGLHWQRPPHGETKLVRVTRGSAFDVAVDLRADSPTRGRWFGCTLTADNRLSLLIPRGFAHGFLTLTPDTEVAYAIDGAHAPEAATGARFDDPGFAIDWPAAPGLVGERDLSWPRWRP